MNGPARKSRLHPGVNLGSTDPVAHGMAEEKLFGFWIFLMSDVIAFSLLFATYAVMVGQLADGPTGRQVFDLRSIFGQTLLLLFSSFAIGQANLAMKYGHRGGQFYAWGLATLALGIGFLMLELRDFAAMLSAGAGPGRSGFLSAFWGLVPLHGVHVLLACVWLSVMLLQVWRFGCEPFVKTRFLRLALFWHFLDLVWIGIFTMVYLQAFL